MKNRHCETAPSAGEAILQRLLVPVILDYFASRELQRTSILNLNKNQYKS